MDDLVLEVYEQALCCRSASRQQLTERTGASGAEIDKALDVLRDLRLVRTAEAPDHFVALSPDATEVQMIAPLELGILERRQRLAEIREELHEFTIAFDNFRSTMGQEAIVVSRSIEETKVRLASAARRCRDEVITMQPGGSRDERELADALPRDLEMLRRGVRMRVVYQHPARTDQATRGYVGEVTAAGAEVRTSGELFDRLIIFDREVAFIPRHADAGTVQSAAVVREPTIVAFLGRIYEHIWRSATVFDLDTVAYGDAVDELKLTILELLASGLKDEVIAKRLGMSARTCRRHIAALLTELRAASRFQAGVAAAHAGLVEGHAASRSLRGT